MKYTKLISSALITLICLAGASASAKSDKTPVRGIAVIWEDGDLYDSFVTASVFNAPPSQSLDILYNFSMSGLMGQRSVSESAPGEPGYNSGRWWVHMVVFTPEGLAALDGSDANDGVIDWELTSDEEVLYAESLGYLEIIPTTTYVHCPLFKTKAN